VQRRGDEGTYKIARLDAGQFVRLCSTEAERTLMIRRGTADRSWWRGWARLDRLLVGAAVIGVGAGLRRVPGWCGGCSRRVWRCH